MKKSHSFYMNLNLFYIHFSNEYELVSHAESKLGLSWNKTISI